MSTCLLICPQVPKINATQTHYERLEVERHASIGDIESKYKSMSKKRSIRTKTQKHKLFEALERIAYKNEELRAENRATTESFNNTDIWMHAT